MHADPSDRIGPATLLGMEMGDKPSVPTAVLFARAVALPFLRWRRWIAYGFVPCCILMGEAYVGYRGLIAFDAEPWLNVFEAQPLVAGPSNPTLLVALAVGLPLLLCCALGFWLCTWQRDVGRQFADPVGKSLLRGLLRLPSYLPALAIWVIVPVSILFALNMILINGILGQLDSIAVLSETAPIRIWLALGGGVAALLFSLWLSARLSPLPVVVAALGWRNAWGNAWGLSEGRGLGIALSFFLYNVLGGFVGGLGIVGTVTLSQVTGVKYQGSADALIVFAFLAFSVLASIVALFCCTSLAALLVQESIGDREIDPATFD
jgi:hypothetical protein